MERNKGSFKAAIEGNQSRVLEATWGCQCDGLDVTGEYLHGRKAGKQIKRDEWISFRFMEATWSPEPRREKTSLSKLRGPRPHSYTD